MANGTTDPFFSLGFDPTFAGFTNPLPDPAFSDLNFANFNLGFDPTFDFGGFDFSQFGLPPPSGDPLALPSLSFSLFPGQDFSRFSLPSLPSFGAPTTLDPMTLFRETGPSRPGLSAAFAGEGPRSVVDVGRPGGFLPPDVFDWSRAEGDFSAGGQAGPGEFNARGGGVPVAPLTQQDVWGRQLDILEKQEARLGREPTLFEKLLSLASPTAQLGGAALTAFAPARKPRIHPAEEALLGAQAEDIRTRGDRESALQERQLETQREIAALRARAERREPLLSRPEFLDIRQALSAALAGPGAAPPPAQAQAPSPQAIQFAQPLIAELRKTADQRRQQALELANQQGLNPAAILAEIDAQQQRDEAKVLTEIQQQLMDQESRRQLGLLDLFGRLGATTV